MAIAWLLLGAVLAAPATQDAPIDWPSTLQKDLEAADAAMRGSHPGPLIGRTPDSAPSWTLPWHWHAPALERRRVSRATGGP